MMEIFQELEDLVYGYKSDFNGKVISKGVIEDDGREDVKIEKWD